MQDKKTGTVAKDKCRILTPEFRVSYPHLFKPQAPKPTDKPKYSITMLFDKKLSLVGTHPVTGEEISIKQVMRNAKLAFYGAEENWPEELETPVVDGDAPKHKAKEGYAGCWVIKATSTEEYRPGVVQVDAKTQITNPGDLYPGCYARAILYCCRWEYMGKEGIRFSLDHVQKIRDGKPFGGRMPVGQAFSPIEGIEADGLDEETSVDFA